MHIFTRRVISGYGNNTRVALWWRNTIFGNNSNDRWKTERSRSEFSMLSTKNSSLSRRKVNGKRCDFFPKTNVKIKIRVHDER